VLCAALGAPAAGAEPWSPRTARLDGSVRSGAVTCCAVPAPLHARQSTGVRNLPPECAAGADLWPSARSMHTANKLATKHERVALSKAAESPQCDICQDGVAALFCADDRALMCRRWGPERARPHQRHESVLAHARSSLPDAPGRPAARRASTGVMAHCLHA